MGNLNHFSFIDEDDPPEYVPEWPTGLPEPGMYEGISFSDYLAWRCVSQSGLKYARETSAKHLRAAMDGKVKSVDTKAKAFGSAVHCAILEPERFDNDYLIAEACSAKITTGARAGEACGNAASRVDGEGRWLCGVHGRGITPVANLINQDDAAAILNMQASLRSHPVVGLLRQQSGHEVSCIAKLDGHPIKARLDFFAQRQTLKNGKTLPPTIVDLKKIARDQGHEYALQKQIIRYGYDVQSYVYSKIVHDLIGEWPTFVWLFVEDGGIYDIAAYKCPPVIREVGRVKFERIWDAYRQWVEMDFWPGYTQTLETMSVDAQSPYRFECQKYEVEWNIQ